MSEAVGYIMLSRRITNSAIMDKPPLFIKWWMWMLCKANHTTVNERGQTFNRGELITTYSEMREVGKYQVGWRSVKPSNANVETCLKWMKKEQMISTRKTTRGLFIYLMKYDHYQNGETYAHTYNEINTDNTKLSEHDDTINKNDNNEENDNKNTSGSRPGINFLERGGWSKVTLGQSQNKSSDSVISFEWQTDAHRYAEALKIDLSPEYEKRWYKMFKEASEGRNKGNLRDAYSYLYDHPRSLSNTQKILLFFKIFENGLQELNE